MVTFAVESFGNQWKLWTYILLFVLYACTANCLRCTYLDVQCISYSVYLYVREYTLCCSYLLCVVQVEWCTVTLLDCRCQLGSVRRCKWQLMRATRTQPTYLGSWRSTRPLRPSWRPTRTQWMQSVLWGALCAEWSGGVVWMWEKECLCDLKVY